MLSEKLDRPLSTKEKLNLGVHTSMCSSCRQFGKQMQELRFISKRYTKGENESNK
jgi:hypothetical protein